MITFDSDSQRHFLDRESRRSDHPYTHFVLPILALVGISLICCLNPQVQQWISSTFSKFLTGDMTLGYAIVTIGVPSVFGTILLTCSILLIKKHQRRSYETFQDGSCTSYLETIKASLLTSKKFWMMGTVTIASLILTAFALWHFQSFQNLLEQPIKIWQGVVFLGGGSMGITGLILAIINTKDKAIPERDDLSINSIELAAL